MKLESGASQSLAPMNSPASVGKGCDRLTGGSPTFDVRLFWALTIIDVTNGSSRNLASKKTKSLLSALRIGGRFR